MPHVTLPLSASGDDPQLAGPAYPPSKLHSEAEQAPVLPPLLLRAAQAAAYCGVSPATWWRWDSAGKIPRGQKVSNGVKVWNRLELENWAALGLPPRAEFEARMQTVRNGSR
jgi:predicted DNA-binding transcriptional regulator AlpA